MADERNFYYDLAILAKFGDINFLKVARGNLALTVGDYYQELLKFEAFIPKISEAFARIAGGTASEEDFQNMTIAKECLKKIGLTKVVPEIDDIFAALQKNRIQHAANTAAKALEDFNRLARRILASKKIGKPEPFQTEEPEEGGDTEKPDFEAQALNDTLLKLEKEEDTRKLKVLAIDDAPVMITTISAVLEEEYKVYGMTNPTMLEKFLSQITPDLFLLDYEMPERNGFELIPIIRNFEEHKDTPIIFLTSMGTMDHVSAALKLGARDFIVKPFQGENLIEKVKKHSVRKKLLF